MFNAKFTAERYHFLLTQLEARCQTKLQFRVAETPVFLPRAMLDAMASAGADLTRTLLAWPEYLASAKEAIPENYRIAGISEHPNFLTADFALVRANPDSATELVPRLVELQAFPSVFAYQEALNLGYRTAFALPEGLGTYLGGTTEESFWDLLRSTVLGNHSPENVVLLEIDPFQQKTLPDFLLTREKLGISVTDIQTLVPMRNKLHYRNETGNLIPIHRIYNRAIADEMIARQIRLPFDLTAPWDVEWAGHPNWYFLISKYSIPWLSRASSRTGAAGTTVPPAVFLSDFLHGDGLQQLRDAGVELPATLNSDHIYENLLLKPLFSFAGKGIQFAPSHAQLQAIPTSEQANYLLQQRMHFEPTIQTPKGLTQAEIRILYVWPDGGDLTPVLTLVRLGRGKMMGVDHNRDQEWVGASAAFWR
jgi:hypothetical protein